MMEEHDGLPRVGGGFGKLGVRIRDLAKPDLGYDLKVTSWDDLVPAGQGLSCTTESPEDFLKRLQHPLGKKMVFFEIDGKGLPPQLIIIEAAEEGNLEHKLIVPCVSMNCREFMGVLALTRPLWRRV